MRVLVTGAHGFTGRYVTSELVRRGHEALALEADLLDGDALRREAEAVRPDATIHLAARAFVASDDYLHKRQRAAEFCWRAAHRSMAAPLPAC
jgi:nucleoside-diphosphate-sugar epimerase